MEGYMGYGDELEAERWYGEKLGRTRALAKLVGEGL